MTINKSLSSELFSERIIQVPRSFIRDILKVTESPDIISFAGGLPNKNFFPVDEIREAAISVLTDSATSVLQYAVSEGLLLLRERIAGLYESSGIRVSPEQILITTGSQQALDLIGKVLINKGDKVLIEEPAYLGAIQAFSLYRPDFVSIPLHNAGLDIELFRNKLYESVKLAYLVPNFQNPSGITYNKEIRCKIAELISETDTILIEDDPYGRIRFKGESQENIFTHVPENTILLGTFSKTIAPGLRIGWMVIPEKMFSKFVIAKQASDLHSDILAQHILNKCLSIIDLDKHMEKICIAYGKQAETMCREIDKHFPNEVRFTRPEGGMFTWLTLPDDFSSMKLFKEAIKENVAFVPGVPFYLRKSDCNTLRLNFSCSGPEEIKEGISRLAGVYHRIISSK